MESEVRYSLCPSCDACPEVTFSEEGVTIGEDENTVRLSNAEWNVLVRAVRAGDLQTAPEPDEDGR